MTFPYGLMGDPFQENAAPVAPTPFARKPSIADRLAARLFPAANYAGLFDPGETSGLQGQALQKLGLGLLAQSGPHPQGTGPNLGQAIAGAMQNVDFPGMAQQALQLKQYRNQLDMIKRRQSLLANIPQTGGDVQGWVDQILPQFIGDPETLRALVELKKSYANPEAHNLQDVPGVDTRPGSPTFGQKGRWLLQPGTTKRLDFIPEGQDAAKPPIDASQVVSEANGQLAKWQPVGNVVAQYQAAKALGNTPAGSDALKAAARAISNVPGGYIGDESAIAGLPFGKLLEALSGIGNKQLTPAQRADLIGVTDRLVAGLTQRAQQTHREQRDLLKRIPNGAGLEPYLIRGFGYETPTPPSTRPKLDLTQ